MMGKSINSALQKNKINKQIALLISPHLSFQFGLDTELNKLPIADQMFCALLNLAH